MSFNKCLLILIKNATGTKTQRREWTRQKKQHITMQMEVNMILLYLLG